MNLRTSKALKLFAILLFSFEMIAAALISSTVVDVEAFRQSQETRFHSNEGHFSFLQAFLFEETNGEEERESKDQKTSFVFASFDLFEAIDIASADRRTAWVEQYKIMASQPPLFTLFHTYII